MNPFEDKEIDSAILKQLSNRRQNLLEKQRHVMCISYVNELQLRLIGLLIIIA